MGSFTILPLTAKMRSNNDLFEAWQLGNHSLTGCPHNLQFSQMLSNNSFGLKETGCHCCFHATLTLVVTPFKNRLVLQGVISGSHQAAFWHIEKWKHGVSARLDPLLGELPKLQPCWLCPNLASLSPCWTNGPQSSVVYMTFWRAKNRNPALGKYRYTCVHHLGVAYI